MNKKRIKTSSDLHQQAHYYNNNNSQNESQFNETDGADTGYEEDFGKLAKINFAYVKSMINIFRIFSIDLLF